MKTMMMTVKWAAGLMLAATLTASAQQGPGPGGRGPQGGGPQGGPGGGEFQPPSPEEIAKRIMLDFDAYKDGKLNKDELLKSVESRHQQRQQQGGPQGGPGGGPQGLRGGPMGGPQGGGPGGGPQGGPGGFQGGPQGGPQGERPQPPAPEQIAAKWVEEFDADKNGSLSSEELQKALASRRPPQGGGPRGGGPQGGPGF